MMRVRSTIFIALFFFAVLPHLQFAQEQSIEQDILNSPEEERIYLLYNLANENLNKDLKKTFIYAHEALRLANKLDDKLGTLLANYVLAEAHLLQENYQESMRLLLASQNIANELQNDSLIVSIQKRIGIVYYEKGDINKAIVLLHRVEKKLRVIDDKRRLARTINYLGRAYSRLKKYNYSYKYFNEVRKIAVEMNDSALLGRALNNIGVIHEVKGEYDSALKYFLESLEIKRSDGSKHEIAITLGHLGSVYLAKNDFKKSEKFINEGLELADSIHNLRLVRNFLNFLGTLKVKTGNYQEALNYNLLADSVDNRRQAEYAEQRYEELKILFELDQIIEDNEASLKKSKTLTYIFLAFASIVLIFLIIVSSLYLKKKKANLELEKSKSLLNERYEFIEFISRTSTDFINLPFNEIDATILRTLEFAVKLTKVERGFIFLISSDGKKLILSHEWCSPELTSINKIKPEIDIEQSGIDLNKFKKSQVSTFQISNAYKSIHFEFLSNELSNLQIKSLTNIALAIGDNVIGIIGFGSSSKEIFWTEEDTHLYKLIGQIIANAINRKEMNEELISNEYQFRSVWENSFDAMRLTDETGKLIEVNKAFGKLVNMEKENLLGQSFGVIYEDYKQNNSLIQYINFFDSRATKDNYETLLSLWDGRKLWVEVSTTFTEGKDGQIFLLTIFRDINSKKLAESSLIESEKKYRTLIDNMQETVFLVQDSKVVFVNNTMQAELGYKNEEILGKPFSDFISPKDLEMVTDNYFKKLAAEYLINQYEFRLLTKGDKKEIYVSMTASMIEYTGKKAILGTLKNITDRKKSELFNNSIQKLSEVIQTEQSEQNLYKSIHDIISDLLPAKNLYIAIYDPKNELVSFPYFVDEIDSPPPPEELGNGLTSFVIRSQKPLLANEQMIQKLEEEKKIDLIGPQSFVWLGVPFSIGDKLKGVIAVQSYDEGVSYTSEDEKTLSYFADTLSITLEKKRTDDKIAQLSRAVEESPVSVVITDPNGFIEYVNLTFTKVTGYSLDEVIGRKSSILKSEFQSDQVYKELWETITAGGNWSGELLNKKKNGELFWELVSISSIKNNQGEITNFIAVKDDITKAKKYEEELLIAKEKAEEMNRLKSNFLSNMSHELRTPLIGILGYAEILSEEIIHDSQKNMILGILEGGKRLSTTLNMILDLARIESNKMEIMINDFHVNDILETEVYLFYAPAKIKNLKLDLVISNNDCYIAVDEKIFSSIISNLINNAIKYTNEGGITVQVDKIIYESKKYCEIKIIDTGIGIPQDSLSVIFEEFRQVSEGYSRHFEGTGLGLTITKRFVELLNGKIFVESDVGKGTTMSVIFPIVDKPAKLKKK